MPFIQKKESKLFLLLSAFFLTNALIAEFMGVKIFSLEKTLGIESFNFHFFGENIQGLSLTCGVILWPFVFILTDVINEYFGVKGVKMLSYIAAGMIAYSFVMLNLAMAVTPASWWIHSSNLGTELNFNDAYCAVFGQGNKIIIASLIAFVLGQLLDVYLFHWIKTKTGEKYIWLRSTGSTLFSQLIDSFVVLFLAFYAFNYGSKSQWTLGLVMAVCTLNYFYKVLMALILTPLIYILHAAIENFLGKELAHKLKQDAIEATN